MNTFKTPMMRVIVVTACLSSMLTAIAEAGTRYVNSPEDSFVRVEGDSTLHGWDAESDSFTISVDPVHPFKGHDLAPGDRWEGSMEFELHADTLTSGRRGLDRQMHASLLADEHPVIDFTLLSAEIQETKDDAMVLMIEGDMTCAGVTRTKQIDVTISLEEDALIMSGRKEMKMSDFDIDPPRAMLGAIRAADEIEVSFHFVLKPE